MFSGREVCWFDTTVESQPCGRRSGPSCRGQRQSSAFKTPQNWVSFGQRGACSPHIFGKQMDDKTEAEGRGPLWVEGRRCGGREVCVREFLTDGVHEAFENEHGAWAYLGHLGALGSKGPDFLPWIQGIVRPVRGKLWGQWPGWTEATVTRLAFVLQRVSPRDRVPCSRCTDQPPAAG